MTNIPVEDEEPEKETFADVAARVDASVKKIEALGILELAEHTRAMRAHLRASRTPRDRLPVPFVLESLGGGERNRIVHRPFLPIRPTHLVVSHETAAHFDLEDVRIGARSVGGVSGDPTPLDVFTPEHYASSPHLVEIMRWRMSTDVQVGQDWMLSVRNRSSHPRRFAGIFWCDIIDDTDRRIW